MYNLTKNNHHLKPKNSNIYTPKEVSQFIFELLKDKIPKDNVIFDPCCGKGSLLKPWKEAGWITAGNDIDFSLNKENLVDCVGVFYHRDFLDHGETPLRPKKHLILCNPPFNGMAPKLAPEMWLDKIIELFGKDIPIVLFAPIGLRICNDLKSKRWKKWTNGTYPPISSYKKELANDSILRDNELFEKQQVIKNSPDFYQQAPFLTRGF